MLVNSPRVNEAQEVVALMLEAMRLTQTDAHECLRLMFASTLTYNTVVDTLREDLASEFAHIVHAELEAACQRVHDQALQLAAISPRGLPKTPN